MSALGMAHSEKEGRWEVGKRKKVRRWEGEKVGSWEKKEGEKMEGGRGKNKD